MWPTPARCSGGGRRRCRVDRGEDNASVQRLEQLLHCMSRHVYLRASIIVQPVGVWPNEVRHGSNHKVIAAVDVLVEGAQKRTERILRRYLVPRVCANVGTIRCDISCKQRRGSNSTKGHTLLCSLCQLLYSSQSKRNPVALLPGVRTRVMLTNGGVCIHLHRAEREPRTPLGFGRAYRYFSACAATASRHH